MCFTAVDKSKYLVSKNIKTQSLLPVAVTFMFLSLGVFAESFVFGPVFL